MAGYAAHHSIDEDLFAYLPHFVRLANLQTYAEIVRALDLAEPGVSRGIATALDWQCTGRRAPHDEEESDAMTADEFGRSAQGERRATGCAGWSSPREENRPDYAAWRSSFAWRLAVSSPRSPPSMRTISATSSSPSTRSTVAVA